MWRRMKKGRADTCNYRIIGFCVNQDTTKKRLAMGNYDDIDDNVEGG